MTEILDIDQFVLSNEQIGTKKEIRKIFIIFSTIGVIILFAGLFTEIKNNADIAPILVFGGFLTFAVGLFGCLIRKKVFYLKSTNDKLFKHELAINEDDKTTVIDALKLGDATKILQIVDKKEISKYLLSVYKNKGNDMMYVQVKEYVPYRYVPLTETILIKK